MGLRAKTVCCPTRAASPESPMIDGDGADLAEEARGKWLEEGLAGLQSTPVRLNGQGPTSEYCLDVHVSRRVRARLSKIRHACARLLRRRSWFSYFVDWWSISEEERWIVPTSRDQPSMRQPEPEADPHR